MNNSLMMVLMRMGTGVNLNVRMCNCVFDVCVRSDGMLEESIRASAILDNRSGSRAIGVVEELARASSALEYKPRSNGMVE